MKYLFPLIFFSLFSFGQDHWLGFQGGYQFYRSGDRIYYGNEGTYIPKHTYRFGIVYRYDFHKYLFVTSKIVYSDEGFRSIHTSLVRRNESLGIYQYRSANIEYDLDFLSIPLSIGFRYGKRVYFSLEAGLVPQFLLGSKTTADYLYDDIVTYNSYNESTKVFMQCQFGLGIGVKVSSNFNIVLLSNYYRGLFKYKKKEDFEGFGFWKDINAHIPDGYTISIQFLFNLNKVRPNLLPPTRRRTISSLRESGL